MRTAKIIFVTMLCSLSSTYGQEDVAKRLQSILRLPTISLSPGLAFRLTYFGAEPILGLEVFSPSALRSEREALERKLSGAFERDAPIYRQIAKISEQLGDREKAKWAWEQAVRCYTALVEKEPKNWRLHLHLVEALEKSNRDEEAETELKRLANLFPDIWEVQMAMGVWEFNRPYRKPFEGLQPLIEAVNAAMSHWQKASQLAPKEPFPYLAMSWGYLQIASFAENLKERTEGLVKAKDMAWLAAEHNMNDPFLLSWAIMMELSGLRKERQQQLNKSIEQLKQLAQSGKYHSAWGFLGLVSLFMVENIASTKTKEAQDYFEKAAKFEPDRWIWREFLIGIAVEQERWQDALNIAEDWLRNHELPRARFLAAKAAEKLGDWEKVENHLKAALRDDENDFYANLGMVVVELRKGEPREAVNRAMPYWQKVSKLTPPDKEAYLSSKAVYGVMLALIGQRKEAIEVFKQILQEEPENQMAKDAMSILEE